MVWAVEDGFKEGVVEGYWGGMFGRFVFLSWVW